MQGKRKLHLSKCSVLSIKRMSLTLGGMLHLGKVLVKIFRSIQIKVHFRLLQRRRAAGWSNLKKKNQIRENADTPLKSHTRPYLEF